MPLAHFFLSPSRLREGLGRVFFFFSLFFFFPLHTQPKTRRPPQLPINV
jgi:hypothetical protein